METKSIDELMFEGIIEDMLSNTGIEVTKEQTNKIIVLLFEDDYLFGVIHERVKSAIETVLDTNIDDHIL